MITVVVEGNSDEQLARALVREAGGEVDRLFVTGGKAKLDAKLPNYIRAASRSHWIVFRDTDSECPVSLRQRLTGGSTSEPELFSLRLAHTMSEAWLLADREAFSEFFNVPVNRITSDPESLPHAKRALIQLCAGSRSRRIQSDMTVDGIKPGPLYVSQLNEFARASWRPQEAQSRSQSLRRALEDVQLLVNAA